jgi:hypothetical protein
MDNVQNCDSYINIPSSQTYRSYRVRLTFKERHASPEEEHEGRKHDEQIHKCSICNMWAISEAYISCSNSVREVRELPQIPISAISITKQVFVNAATHETLLLDWRQLTFLHLIQTYWQKIIVTTNSTQSDLVQTLFNIKRRESTILWGVLELLCKQYVL